MTRHPRFRPWSPLVGAALAFVLLTAHGPAAFAQSIRITNPNNDDSVTPGAKFDVTGVYSATGVGPYDILLRMWEVNSNDDTVGNPVDQDLISFLSTAMEKSWGIGLDAPAPPAGTSRRYKITAQLKSGMTVLDTSSIFVDISSSGGP